MESSWLMSFAVFALAVMLLVQTILIVLSTTHLRRRLRSLDRTLRLLSEHADRSAAFSDNLLAAVEDFTPRIPEAGNSIVRELEEYTLKAKKADDFLGRRVDLLRYRLRETESRLSGILDAASRHACTLQKAALYPSAGLGSLTRSGIDLAKRAVDRRSKAPVVSAQPVEVDGEHFV